MTADSLGCGLHNETMPGASAAGDGAAACCAAEGEAQGSLGDMKPGFPPLSRRLNIGTGTVEGQKGFRFDDDQFRKLAS